jgi:hypothetical protein
MTTRILSPIALLLAGLVWLGVFVFARWLDPAPECLPALLKRLAPWAFLVSAAVVIAGGILDRWGPVETCRRLGARSWLWIGALVAATLAARLATIPATERVYYDEHSYLQMARGIAAQGRVEVAVCATIGQGGYECREGEYPHWSAGWPTLAAGVMRLASFGRWIGPVVNLALSLATVVLAAIVAFTLLNDPRAVIAAAAVAACVPANLAWSRTSAPEVFAAFAATLAVATAARFPRHPSYGTGILLGAALAMAAQVRNELVVLVPVAGVFVAVIGWRQAPQSPWRGSCAAVRMAAWPAVLAVVLLLPQALHLGFVSRCYEPYAGPGSGLAAQHVPGNLAAASDYLLHEPVAALCLALAVVALMMPATRGLVWPTWLWGLSVGLVPLFHFGGSYNFPGGERFLLAWLPAAAIGAGTALGRLWALVDRRVPVGMRTLLAATVVLAALLWGGPHTLAMDDQTSDVRGDCAFLRAALEQTPEDALIVTADPPAVLVEGRSAALVTWACCEPARLDDLSVRCPGGLYFYTSPSSLPEQWPSGAQAWEQLAEWFLLEPVVVEWAPRGWRVLYRLTDLRAGGQDR